MGKPSTKRLACAGSAIAISSFALHSVSSFALHKLLHPKRKENIDTPEKIGLPYHDITIMNGEVPLEGWLIPGKAESGLNPLIMAILLHGYTSNRSNNSSSLPLMKFFHELGITTLSYDARAHGESGGEISTIGYKESDDLAAVYASACQLGYQPNILLGRSMGAATIAMQAAKLPNIQQVILDSPLTGLDKVLENDFANWTPLPKYPLTPMIIAKARAKGLDPNRVRPIDEIGKEEFPPTLMFHSNKDPLIRVEHSHQLIKKRAEEAKNAKEANKDGNFVTRLMVTDAIGHTTSFKGYPDDYEITDKELRKYQDYPQQYLESIGQELERNMGFAPEKIQQALRNTLGNEQFEYTSLSPQEEITIGRFR